MELADIFTLENLNNAFYESSKISHWKESTHRYKANLLLNNIQLQEDLLSGNYKISKTVDFTLNERGKIRYIKSPALRDRIVQKVLCKQVLVPQLTKYLIYDNYASLKNRGTAFARKRVDVLLKRYIRKYGNDGYVLKIDIKKYFDNIDHKILKQLVKEKIKESREIMKLIDYIIDNSSESHKGLNLGSEAPQIFAIFYLSKLDNYLKSVKGLKYVGRYMDDIFIISNSKKELRILLDEIKNQLSLLNLEINEKKTYITTLSHGFTFLQIKYNVNGNKIIKRLTHSKIARERRRLRKFKKQYDLGKMTEIEIRNCYKSWRNNVIKDCNACYRTIKSIDNLYDELFTNKEVYHKPTREEVIKQTFKENADYFVDLQHLLQDTA